VQVFALKVRANGWKIRHFLRDNSSPVAGVVELKAASQQALQLPLQLYQVYLRG
jgi:hypothetical protein